MAQPKFVHFSSTTLSSIAPALTLLICVSCSNQAPLVQPLVNMKQKNTNTFSEKSSSDSQKSDSVEASATVALSSSELSSEVLNQISSLSEDSVASLFNANFHMNLTNEKCGFFVASTQLNDAFKQKAESRGWLSTTKPNIFKLKVDDGSKTYQQCRCLAASVTTAAEVILIPILNP